MRAVMIARRPGANEGQGVRGVSGPTPYSSWWRRSGWTCPPFGVDRAFTVTGELTGESYLWGAANYVRVDPATRPAHIFTVTPNA
jgi:hypothetical protein